MFPNSISRCPRKAGRAQRHGGEKVCACRCRSDKTHSFSKGSLGSQNTGKLEIGESFYFGGKEIEIQRIISESDWGSGKCFLLNSSGVHSRFYLFNFFIPQPSRMSPMSLLPLHSRSLLCPSLVDKLVRKR